METPPPPVQMVQLLAGFQISQALYVAAKLDVARLVLDRPRTADDLASEVGADPVALGRLLRTLASLGLFTCEGDGAAAPAFAATPLGATLASGTPGSMRDMAIMWMETHYLPFSELLHTVRTGECGATHHYGEPFFDWLSRDAEQVARFTASMRNLTEGIRAGAVAGYRLPPAEVVVDVGGADGSLLAMLLAADPDPTRRGIVFDLPHVVPAAEEHLAAQGLRDRIDVAAGDFFTGVPTADGYLVSMILHDWDDASCGKLFAAVRAAARPGARFVALELVVPPGAEPHMAKMIDLTMLGMLTGRERSDAEFRSLFETNGLRVDRIVATPTPLSIVEATVVAPG
jgi:hypothetical protein